MPYDYALVSFSGADVGRRALLQGMTFGRGWSFKDDTATWIGSETPEIALRLVRPAADGYRMTLTLQTEASAVPAVVDVNDHVVPLAMRRRYGCVLCAELPPHVVEHHNCHLRMRFPCKADGTSLRLASIHLQPIHLYRVTSGSVVRFGADGDGVTGLVRGFAPPGELGRLGRWSFIRSPTHTRLSTRVQHPAATRAGWRAVGGRSPGCRGPRGERNPARGMGADFGRTIHAHGDLTGARREPEDQFVVSMFYARLTGGAPQVAIGRERHPRTFGLLSLTVGTEAQRFALPSVEEPTGQHASKSQRVGEL